MFTRFTAITTLGLSCLAVSSVAIADSSTQKSAQNKKKEINYSVISIGFEQVSYQESITNFLGGIQESENLKTKTSVMNPMHRSKSYSTLSDDWGVYIGTSSTLIQNVEKEDWKLGSFGSIQENDFKVSSSELEIKAAYQLYPGGQFIIGTMFNTYDYSRYHLKESTGSAPLNKVLKDFIRQKHTELGDSPEVIEAEVAKAGLKIVTGAITESSDNIEIGVGYAYDSEFAQNGNWHWYAGAEISVPLYYRVINSSSEGNEHTGSVSEGFGLHTYAGTRYLFTENVSFDLGLRGIYKKRDQLEKTLDNGGTQTLPDITYQSMQYFIGLNWRH
ncbi:hypothetical protein [Algibacillus agarilyticus]|uniref:hypothetical protein n=1 Tax=Algibacillus agarilyticus TaxID=2234133 RepID=UPI000DCF9624|nr:hypothetical protein [Algibacillus agarilyticus]